MVEYSGPRALLSRVNVSVALATLALLVFGTVVVASATKGMQQGMLQRHLIGVVIGLVVLAALWVLDYHTLEHWIVPLLAGLVVLLLLPKIPHIGATLNGASSWIKIGPLTLQPSEPGKLVFAVVMASVIAGYKGSIEKVGDVAKCLGYTAIPVLLLLFQKDLGTALVYIVIALGMLLVGGLKPRWFAVMGVVGVIVVGIAIQPGVLQTYQRNRLLVFVDNSLDPHGAGWNLQQSKTAIGSGELFGKGLGSGTQGNLGFIPERATDFIFSVLGEELGFVGALTLLGLYLWVLWGSLAISTSSRDLFGALIVIGVMSMWLFQILENVGMTLGIMPVTGIPLPFMSFGSSFMVTNLAAVGLLMSVWARRYGT